LVGLTAGAAANAAALQDALVRVGLDAVAGFAGQATAELLATLEVQAAAGALWGALVIAGNLPTPAARTLRVAVEVRTLGVEEVRVFGVPGEVRVLDVAFEDRIVQVERESRTVRA
jgi:hypothetical protein